MQNQIPNTWQSVKASDLCIRVADGTHDTPSRLTRSDHPMITSKQLKEGKIEETDYYISDKDFFEVNRRSKVDQWDVLFGMIGTIGDLVIVKDKYPQFAIKNVGLFKTGEDEILAKWIYYFIKSPQGKAYIRSVIRGTSQGYIPLESLREFPIMIPEEKKERIKIISILSSFDDKIEINNKIARTLEEMMQLIFKEWFVDFRFPTYEKIEFVDSEFGRIPKGWNIRNLAQILTLKHGYAFKSEQFITKKTKNIVVRMGNFKETGGLQFSDNTFYLAGVNGYDKHVLVPRDMVMIFSDITREGRLIGNVGLIPDDENIYILNQRVAKIEHGEVYKYFLLILFNSKIFHLHCMARADSATVLNLKNEHIYEYKMALPNADILEDFNKVVEPIVKKVELIKSENQKLITLRDLLLPKLMRGEIRV